MRITAIPSSMNLISRMFSTFLQYFFKFYHMIRQNSIMPVRVAVINKKSAGSGRA